MINSIIDKVEEKLNITTFECMSKNIMYIVSDCNSSFNSIGCVVFKDYNHNLICVYGNDKENVLGIWANETYNSTLKLKPFNDKVILENKYENSV